MTKVLFICHGNICRSPMAEFVFKDLVKKKGLESNFYIASAATSREEIGNSVYPGAKKMLAEHNISCKGKQAIQVTKWDYDAYDYLIVMEEYNIGNLMRIIKKDSEKKVYKLLDFTDNPKDIDDPWYSRDFETTYREIVKGCEGFLNHIESQELRS